MEKEYEHNAEIDSDGLLDSNVKLHPEISQWRDAYRVDLRLLHSLEDTGQIQNCVFRALDDGVYELVVGARRYLHQKMLGTEWEDIPKTIREMSDRQAFELAATENFFREDLNKWEEARVISDLAAKAGFTVKELATKFGVSEDSIRGRMKLMQLPKEIRARFEKLDAPIGYAAPILKLSEYPEAQTELVDDIEEGIKSSYGGITTVEAAEEFVTRVNKRIAEQEELVRKYGTCPKCGSKNIAEASWGDEDKLSCNECGHDWHKETKEPWEYYELKQKAEAMGLEIEEESPEKMKITPKEAADILKEEIAKKKMEAQGEEEEDGLPDKFRTWAPLEEILAPLIDDNLQKFTIKGSNIEIELIENPDLAFKALKKDYVSGEKARVEILTYWSVDTDEAIENVHALMNRVDAFEEPEE